MRTRTLLVLAVGVGLVILVAGSIQLLRIGDGSSADDDLGIGETARAGDLTVTVLSATESDDTIEVQVRVAGVDDPAGFDDFLLLGTNDAVPPSAPADDGACRALTVAEQTCALRYDTSTLKGSTRRLLVRRGEDLRRWSLV